MAVKQRSKYAFSLYNVSYYFPIFLPLINNFILFLIIVLFIIFFHRSDCIEDSETLLIASKALQPVDKHRSLKLIQRAILLHPSNMNAWNALLIVN